ncbi:MAG: DUF362 domain-containing protein [Candidatus Geothermincolia bacterium]
MSNPVWLVGLIKKVFPYRGLADRMTRIPPIGALTDRLLYWGDDILYLPADGVVPVNAEVPVGDQLCIPSQVVEHFVKRTEFLWVMDKCICRDSLHCKDYPIDLGCLFMGEAAMDINPRLGRRVTAEEALAHLEACREAGLVHLIGRNKLDTVWLNVRPGNKLLTVCNCCPCCCLWRSLPALATRISDKVRRLPGVAFEVTGECEGCGECVSGCFVKAINVRDGRAYIDDSCRGCGRCALSCRRQAIRMQVEDPSYLEQAVKRLAGLVDIS